MPLSRREFVCRLGAVVALPSLPRPEQPATVLGWGVVDGVLTMRAAWRVARALPYRRPCQIRFEVFDGLRRAGGAALWPTPATTEWLAGQTILLPEVALGLPAKLSGDWRLRVTIGDPETGWTMRDAAWCRPMLGRMATADRRLPWPAHDDLPLF